MSRNPEIAESDDPSADVGHILAGCEMLRARGAPPGAMMALMHPTKAEAMGLTDGQLLERGPRLVFLRVDPMVPMDWVVVAGMFPDPRETIRARAEVSPQDATD